mmetsp:Transcript_38423/g.119559  ORF Transcript_38423/g.119559 Transcript_38423/m.119559 type:complete len:351 (-) Transcript_38423:4-1056(-)
MPPVAEQLAEVAGPDKGSFPAVDVRADLGVANSALLLRDKHELNRLLHQDGTICLDGQRDPGEDVRRHLLHCLQADFVQLRLSLKEQRHEELGKAPASRHVRHAVRLHAHLLCAASGNGHLVRIPARRLGYCRGDDDVTEGRRVELVDAPEPAPEQVLLLSAAVVHVVHSLLEHGQVVVEDGVVVPGAQVLQAAEDLERLLPRDVGVLLAQPGVAHHPEAHARRRCAHDEGGLGHLLPAGQRLAPREGAAQAAEVAHRHPADLAEVANLPEAQDPPRLGVPGLVRPSDCRRRTGAGFDGRGTAAAHPDGGRWCLHGRARGRQPTRARLSGARPSQNPRPPVCFEPERLRT